MMRVTHDVDFTLETSTPRPYEDQERNTFNMKPMSIKSRPNSPVASTSKDSVIRCPVCEEEYCDPPTEEWTQCQEWWHEESSNYENGTLFDHC
ncbi:uncharacterized protein TNCV_1364941 [Trichonephila clavipes]|nr:uncharacterized protein TNCV_1364941 [Trichonephila clavipes]